MIPAYTIVLRFTYRNFFNDLSEGMHEFHSIEHLEQYFRWEPERAMQVGHTTPDPERLKKARSTNVRLSVIREGKEILLPGLDELKMFIKRV